MITERAIAMEEILCSSWPVNEQCDESFTLDSISWVAEASGIHDSNTYSCSNTISISSELNNISLTAIFSIPALYVWKNSWVLMINGDEFLVINEIIEQGYNVYLWSSSKIGALSMGLSIIHCANALEIGGTDAKVSLSS